MSSLLRKMARKIHGIARTCPGVNSKGKHWRDRGSPGANLKARNGGEGTGALIAVGKQHDLSEADPRCKRCGGTGVAARLHRGGKLVALACPCVPETLKKEKEDG